MAWSKSKTNRFYLLPLPSYQQVMCCCVVVSSADDPLFDLASSCRQPNRRKTIIFALDDVFVVDENLFCSRENKTNFTREYLFSAFFLFLFLSLASCWRPQMSRKQTQIKLGHISIIHLYIVNAKHSLGTEKRLEFLWLRFDNFIYSTDALTLVCLSNGNNIDVAAA